MTADRPQGTVTILFTDVVGSTALATGRGDERAHAILQTQRGLVREQIEAHAGREVKTMGDGFMVAFTSAHQGIACAVSIQQSLEALRRERPDAAVQVRMGLNTGEAIREGSDLFGTAVNVASRVMDKAVGGQILVSESVHQVLGSGTDFRLVERGRFHLKGLAGRHRLYEVLWRAEPVSGDAAQVERLPFVGRQSELARLMPVLKRAAAGRGALVLIGGEAGIGKTRLAEECAAEARRSGFVTLTGRCYEDSSAPPYGPFIEVFQAAARVASPDEIEAALAGDAAAIAQLSPALRAAIHSTAVDADPSGSTKQALFAGVQIFLQRLAASRPIVMLLDDLHWADAAALHLLRFLARDLSAMPVVIFATYRDEPIDMTSAFAQVLDEFHRHHLAIELDLTPFGVEAVEALLEAASGRPAPRAFARTLHDETSGNPFFVEELYRHLADEGRLFDERGNWRTDRIEPESLPRGLRRIIERRLNRLSDATRRMLDAAAVLGATFTIDVLEAVGQMRGDQLFECLDEAERARVITPPAHEHDGRFQFAHPLIRSAIVTGLSSTERQRLHARAADALEQRARFVPNAAEVAYHYRSAGQFADPERAIAAMRRAGTGALDAYANVEAAGHFAAALKLVDRVSDFPIADLAEIVHHHGQSLYRLGDWDASGITLQRALDLYQQAGDVRGQSQVLYSLASLASFDSRPVDSLRYLREARELMPDDESLRGLIYMLESQNLVDLRQYSDAATAKDEALAIAERLSAPYIVNRAHIASGYLALATLDMPSAVRSFGNVTGAAAAATHERMAAESRCAIALACLGDLAAGEERASGARAYFASMRDVATVLDGSATERDPYEFGLSWVASGIAAIARGEFDAIYSSLRGAIQECGNPPNARVVRTLAPMMLQVLHCLDRSDGADMDMWLDMLAPRGEGRQPAFRQLFNALHAHTHGRPNPDAEGLPPRPTRFPDLQSLSVATLAAETAVSLRDADGAREHRSTFEYLNERGMTFTVGWVALVPRLLGAMYALGGEELRAQTTLEQALRIARSTGARMEMALTRLELAELHAARGAVTAAEADLLDARSLFAAIHMRSSDRRVRELTAKLGFRQPPVADGLLDDEVAILRLVAAGLNNRAIAEQRNTTIAALQRQLAALYAKIGAENRLAAIAYAYRTGIAREGE